MSRVLIKNGRVIDPATKLDAIGPVYIEDGKVVAVIQERADFKADEEIDAQDCVVSPGFVDLSVRLREPGYTRKGTIESETRAAVAGGVTSLCLPPDTHPVIDTPAVVEYVKDKAEMAAGAHVFPLAAMTQRLAGKQLSSMFTLKQAGCVAVSNADAFIDDLQVLRRAMEYADSHGLLMIFHPNESSLSLGGCAHEGVVASQYGLPGIPGAAETVAVAQCLELAELTGCRVHFSRLSCRGSVIKIQEAVKYGAKVTADVAMHQLLLTEEQMRPFDSSFHVLPPFRSEQDKEMLVQGLIDGTIHAVCSDHQPQDVDAKLGAFQETEPGISALETLLPLMLKFCEENDVSMTSGLAAITYQPADILGLNKGRLVAGADADICIFNAQYPWQINAQNWLSSGQNTPFWGDQMTGRVMRTLVQGRTVFELT